MHSQNRSNLVEEFDHRLSTAAPKLPVLLIRQKEYVPVDGIREILRGMEAERNTDVPSPEPEIMEERVNAAIGYFKEKLQRTISSNRKKHYQAALEALCYWKEHGESPAVDVGIGKKDIKNATAAEGIKI